MTKKDHPKTATAATMPSQVGMDYWWARWRESDEGMDALDKYWPDEIASIACAFAEWFAQQATEYWDEYKKNHPLGEF